MKTTSIVCVDIEDTRFIDHLRFASDEVRKPCCILIGLYS
jgi:hypothetical protein